MCHFREKQELIRKKTYEYCLARAHTHESVHQNVFMFTMWWQFLCHVTHVLSNCSVEMALPFPRNEQHKFTNFQFTSTSFTIPSKIMNRQETVWIHKSCCPFCVRLFYALVHPQLNTRDEIKPNFQFFFFLLKCGLLAFGGEFSRTDFHGFVILRSKS